ncbi:hypothetical protein OIE68_19085 [Nocardia vinacea]|uniref:DUF4351 domain-containing protein n=1 Tax=Nocardia vinacea TaxID=96468 RepID=A0ABZ1Z0J3_9NOCA|nr:hypothetical protein OIE68_19085 [Nocardia vinacea]
MVSSQHEAMHHLFRQDPGVFARTIRDLGLPFPDPIDVALLPTDLTEIEPLERRVDTLLRVETAEGAFLLLVEAQGHDDKKKPSAWAYYLAHLHAKYRLHPVLLVVCQDAATAAWARGPLTIGPPQWTSLTVHPLVFGPDNVPAVVDLEAAIKDIPLATLSAITHAADDSVIGDIMSTLATALRSIDKPDRVIFAELTALGLGKGPAGQTWRQLMTVDTSFFRSEYWQEVLARGEAKGEAKSILRLLELRGIAVPDDAHARIAACTDLDQLAAWLDRVLVAESIEDLFA